MKAVPVLTPLRDEARAALSNIEAAAHLGLRPQTLRSWASTGSGPIQPLRVANRLRWRTDDLRKLLGEP